MVQNTSSAVMNQRREAPDSFDDFPTPPWATRALLERYTHSDRTNFEEMIVREPAANRGFMVRPLREVCRGVIASDVFDYGSGFPVEDYLFTKSDPFHDFVVTNPPFNMAERFISHALEHALRGVAVFVRTNFLEGVSRHKNLFSRHRPAAIYQFTERVVLARNKMKDPDEPEHARDKNGDLLWKDDEKTIPVMRKPSTATAYCWIVFEKRFRGETRFHWVEPSRQRLTREGDYVPIHD